MLVENLPLDITNPDIGQMIKELTRIERFREISVLKRSEESNRSSAKIAFFTKEEAGLCFSALKDFTYNGSYKV